MDIKEKENNIILTIEINYYSNQNNIIVIIKKKDKEYNNEYWALHGHTYVEARSKNIEHKIKQRVYNEKYRGKTKHIYKDNHFHPPAQKDITVVFKFSFLADINIKSTYNSFNDDIITLYNAKQLTRWHFSLQSFTSASKTSISLITSMCVIK